MRHVKGDRYGGEFPRELFRRRGLAYEVAEQSRSDLYLSLVPAVNSGRVRLLDLPRLEAQLVALERRTTRVGRELVDHPPGGHDDVANAAAGALVTALLAGARGEVLVGYGVGYGKIEWSAGLPSELAPPSAHPKYRKSLAV